MYGQDDKFANNVSIGALLFLCSSVYNIRIRFSFLCDKSSIINRRQGCCFDTITKRKLALLNEYHSLTCEYMLKTGVLLKKIYKTENQMVDLGVYFVYNNNSK